MAGSKPCRAGCVCAKHTRRETSAAQLAHLRSIAHAGALARNLKHGNPAQHLTPESRARLVEGARKRSGRSGRSRIDPDLRLHWGTLSRPLTREAEWLARQPMSDEHRRKLSESNRRNWDGRRGSGRKRRAKISRYVRREVYERDGWVCQLCLEPVDPSITYAKGTTPNPLGHSIDHILSRFHGGTDERENLQLAHFGCNTERGIRMMEMAV